MINQPKSSVKTTQQLAQEALAQGKPNTARLVLKTPGVRVMREFRI
jgi:hypothetical protein